VTYPEAEFVHDLEGVQLTEAPLTGADLSGTIGLTPEQRQTATEQGTILDENRLALALLSTDRHDTLRGRAAPSAYHLSLPIDSRPWRRMIRVPFRKLVTALDDYSPTPEQAVGKPFLMPIEDV
jgi:hypothetical protein